VDSNAPVRIKTSQPQRTINSKKSFADYLHHSNKQALMKKLHELLNDQSKAKDVAITISALIELAFIANYGSKKKLYAAMRDEFLFICSDSGINDFLNSNNNKLTKEDIKPTKDIIMSIN
jgi:hypothetical protein